MNQAQVKELLLQALEHECGGVKVYEAALHCAAQEELNEEWKKYLEQTRTRIQALTAICSALKLDPEEQTSGAKIARKFGTALATAMREAKSGGDQQAAQLVACECVVLAETKDHLDWQLIGESQKGPKGPSRRPSRAPMSASKRKRTNTSIIRAVAAGSSGSNRWG